MLHIGSIFVLSVDSSPFKTWFPLLHHSKVDFNDTCTTCNVCVHLLLIDV